MALLIRTNGSKVCKMLCFACATFLPVMSANVKEMLDKRTIVRLYWYSMDAMVGASGALVLREPPRFPYSPRSRSATGRASSIKAGCHRARQPAFFPPQAPNICSAGFLRFRGRHLSKAGRRSVPLITRFPSRDTLLAVERSHAGTS